MDKIIQIFTQLGADQSIFLQFVIFIVLFVLLKFALFNKLLFVIETREGKTTKMEELATNKFQEADRLAKSFDEQVSQTRFSSIEKSQEEKNSAMKELGKKKTTREREIQAGYDAKKSVVEAEFEVTKKKVMENVALLSDELAQKIAK